MLRAALLAISLGAWVWADKTPEVGQTTIWDEIMKAQSARGVYIGSLYLERRRYDEAVREFAKAVVANPRDPTAHRMLGVAYYWSGQVEQAEQEFNESLRLEPTSAQTHQLLGIVYAWKDETRRAYEEFKRAAELDSERADIEMNLGSIEESLGMIPEALHNFRRAVALDSAHPLYHFQLGMLYRRLGRDEEAVESLKTALRKFPEYQDAMLELGATYERLGRVAEALEMFKKAVRLKERDAVARFRLARAYVLKGDQGKAREVLRDVFHLTPSEKGGLALSVSYGGHSKSPQASGGSPGQGGDGKKLASKEQPEPNDPLNVVARNLQRIPLDQEAVLGVDLAFLPKPKLVRGKAGEAPSSLKSALERAGKPSQAAVLGARREYTFKAGDPAAREAEINKAMADLRSVMAKAPPDSEVRMGMNLSFSERQGSSARSAPESAPKVSYQPHDVGNDLGLWVMGTGWMALVAETLPRAGATQPEAKLNESSAQKLVEGVGFAILGDGSSALEAFGRALELDPRDDLGYLGRGVAMVVVGDEAGAIQACRQALAINPHNRTAAEGLKWLMAPAADSTHAR